MAILKYMLLEGYILILIVNTSRSSRKQIQVFAVIAHCIMVFITVLIKGSDLILQLASGALTTASEMGNSSRAVALLLMICVRHVTAMV